MGIRSAESSLRTESQTETEPMPVPVMGEQTLERLRQLDIDEQYYALYEGRRDTTITQFDS